MKQEYKEFIVEFQQKKV